MNTNSSSNLSDDCFEEMLAHKLQTKSDYSKGFSDALIEIKQLINKEINLLKKENVCEYNPSEFSFKPKPLGRWDRLLSNQELKINTLQALLDKFNRDG